MTPIKILIIGGSGYFGSRLAEYLCRSYEVIVTQRNITNARTIWLRNSGLKCIEYDSSRDSLINGSPSFDVIINLALPSAIEASRDFELAMKKGLAVADTCLNMISEGSARRLIHFSTFHVYGNGGRKFFDESDEPCPTSPYGEVHLACEKRVLLSPNACVLRATNLVGRPAHAALGDQEKLFFLDLCRQAINGKISLHNDGRSYRDFLPFDDAFRAVELLLCGSKPAAQIFNLSSSVSIQLSLVAEMIGCIVNRPSNIFYGKGVDNFRSQFQVNNHRLCSLGWYSNADLLVEARQIIDFFHKIK